MVAVVHCYVKAALGGGGPPPRLSQLGAGANSTSKNRSKTGHVRSFRESEPPADQRIPAPPSPLQVRELTEALQLAKSAAVTEQATLTGQVREQV